MWTFLAVLAFAISTVVYGRGQFVVDGEAADIADFPFQGSYRTGESHTSHSCGCVFVGAQWVLTAGHCGGSSSYTMEFGGTVRGEGQVFGVSEVTRHPGYDDGTGFTNNDVAVVEATSEISGENISPATVYDNPDNPNTQPAAWISGWGRTCGSCALPLTLQQGAVTIRTDAQCSEEFGTNYNPLTMVCLAGGDESGACNGDSGGPLSAYGPNGELMVYGITSWGYTGCPVDGPSTYAKVGAFYDWICANTGNGATGC